MILLNGFLQGTPFLETVQCSVDGKYFRIHEPTLFSQRWVSHTFRGPDLQFKVCMSISGGNIGWVSDLVSCASWPDLKFQVKMAYCRASGEKVVMNRGYRHVGCITYNSREELIR